MTIWTPEELMAFEDEVKERYRAGEIRAPVHLARGNEERLIEVFDQVGPADWVFATYRSHYHALLHGVPRELVMRKILQGNSIHLEFPTYHFYTSAIVGGHIPLALGAALGIKRRVYDGQVWCFLGDMAHESGACDEAIRYAANFELPINFVVECNAVSTNTPTALVWGKLDEHFPNDPLDRIQSWSEGAVWAYCYDRPEGWPHIGIGEWIDFGPNVPVEEQWSWGSEGGARSDVMG